MAVERLRDYGWLALTPTAFSDAILSHGVLHAFKKGEWVYHLDAEPDGLWGIADGGVEIESTRSDRAPSLLLFASSGFWAGYGSVVAGSTRFIGMRATRPTLMMHVSRSAFAAIEAKQPDVWRWVALLITSHLEGTIGLVEDTRILNSRDRVVSVLLRMCNTSWTVGYRDSDRAVTIDLSQDGLARLCSVSRSLLAVILAPLRSEGVIDLSYGRIHVPKPAALRAALTGES
jgi:CRP-like cAMP-binding protein